MYGLEWKKVSIGVAVIAVLIAVAIYVMQDPIDIQAEPIIQGLGNDLNQENDMESLQEDENISINEYVVNLEINPDTYTFNGLAKIRYYNHTNQQLQDIYLHTYLNTFNKQPQTKELKSKKNTPSSSYGWMNIDSIVINNEKMSYTKEELGGRVQLKQPLPSKQTVEMVVSFQGKIPENGDMIGADKNVIWGTHFLPTLSVYNKDGWNVGKYDAVDVPFYTDISNYTVSFTTPKEYTVVGTGTELESEEGNQKITKISARMVRDFGFSMSKFYKKDSEESENGIRVNLYSYSDIEHQKSILYDALGALNYYTKRVGSYPYQEIDIIENSMASENAEAPGMIMLSEKILRKQNNIDFPLVYSIGHQWFYNVVGNNGMKDPWMDRALVFYLQLQYFYNTQKEVENFMKEDIKKLEKELKNIRETKLSRSMDEYTSWTPYYWVVYRKGRAMFYALHGKMGDEKFGEFLQSYYKTYAYQNVSKEEFIGLAERVYGHSLKAFFDEWLNQEKLPKIKISPYDKEYRVD